jgi:hypothetical protein
MKILPSAFLVLKKERVDDVTHLHVEESGTARGGAGQGAEGVALPGLSPRLLHVCLASVRDVVPDVRERHATRRARKPRLPTLRVCGGVRGRVGGVRDRVGGALDLALGLTVVAHTERAGPCVAMVTEINRPATLAALQGRRPNVSVHRAAVVRHVGVHGQHLAALLAVEQVPVQPLRHLARPGDPLRDDG